MPPATSNTPGEPLKSVLKNKNSKSKGMSISFSGKKHIKKIPHLNTMTEEDIEQIWYSHYDYDDIKASFEYTVFMMDAGEAKTVENDEHTTRGLEMRTEEGAWARFEHKRDAYNAVLDEQDRQWNDGEDDPELISQSCLEVSRSAAKGALERGLNDEKASNEINKEIRSTIKNGTFLQPTSGEDGVSALPKITTAPARQKKSGKIRGSVMAKFGG